MPSAICLGLIFTPVFGCLVHPYHSRYLYAVPSGLIAHQPQENGLL